MCYEFYRKKNLKIIVLTGAIAVGKTTLGYEIEKYLYCKGISVHFYKEVTDELEKELRMFNRDPVKYAMWFQEVILAKQKELTERISEKHYDYIILDRTCIDQLVFSRLNIKDEMDIEYITNKILRVKGVNYDEVIYVKPSKEVMIEWYMEHEGDYIHEMLEDVKKYDPEGFGVHEKEMEYLCDVYDQYDQMIDEIYPIHKVFVNEEDVESYDITELLR
jgi:deoxyadenosine/deoxycytidine kinase